MGTRASNDCHPTVSRQGRLVNGRREPPERAWPIAQSRAVRSTRCPWRCRSGRPRCSPPQRRRSPIRRQRLARERLTWPEVVPPHWAPRYQPQSTHDPDRSPRPHRMIHASIQRRSCQAPGAGAPLLLAPLRAPQVVWISNGAGGGRLWPPICQPRFPSCVRGRHSRAEGEKTSSRSSLSQTPHSTILQPRFPASRPRSLRVYVKRQGAQSPMQSATLRRVSERVGTLLYIRCVWTVQRVYFQYLGWRVEMVLLFGAGVLP